MHDDNAPVIVVSSDCHIGPRLVDDLRPYCPPRTSATSTTSWRRRNAVARRHLRAHAGVVRRRRSPATRARPVTTTATPACTISIATVSRPRSSSTAARTKSRFLSAPSSCSSIRRPTTKFLIALGRHIYNQWLADFCALAPARRVGLAQLPLWDIDAAIAEVEWAARPRPARHQLPGTAARVCRCTTTARGNGSGRCARSGACR